jgi:site-specific DNA recombinase
VFDVLFLINIALKNVSHEQQKHVLHSIINRITVNEGKRPKERSIKDIELFFDTSLEDFVLTYGKVLPG